MSVAGNWKVTAKSPMGEQQVAFDFKEDGNAISGTINGAQGAQEFSGGTIDGNALAWVVDIEQPMKIKAEFAAEVDGDKISGTVKFGAMGLCQVLQTREAADPDLRPGVTAKS